MSNFQTIEIPPGPEGVRLALRAVHALFEEEQSVALVPVGNSAAREALLEGTPLHTDEPTLVLATSGSVGKPRALELTVTALAEAAVASASYFGSEAVWLAALPVTGIGGLNPVLRSALAGLQPVEWQEQTFDANNLERHVAVCVTRAHKQGFAAATSLVPTQLHRIAATAGGLKTLARLDYVLVGGGYTPKDLVDAAIEAGVRLVRTYGATETGGGVVYEGTPLAGVQLSFSEADEILIASPTNAQCYRDGTALPSPWPTGDRGNLVDGLLQVHGRIDDVVKVAGHKVDLQQLTKAVQTIPGIGEAVAISIPDEQYGQVPVVAFTGEVTADSVVAAAIAQLGGTRLPVRARHFAELPTLASGKPDRQTIAALCQTPQS